MKKVFLKAKNDYLKIGEKFFQGRNFVETKNMRAPLFSA
jgi:hypothetical protein